MKYRIYFLLMGILFCTSCSKDVIYGEGKVISEFRELSNFSAINVIGDFDVKLIPSSDFSVKLESHGNILPYIKTQVIDGELLVSYQGSSQVVNGRSNLIVQLPDLTGIEMEGDPDVQIIGSFTGEHLRLAGSGNGIVEFDGGSYSNLRVLSVGNFKVKAFDLHTLQCEVETQGNGNLKVNVEEILKVKINGNGLVYYMGNPIVDSEVNGGGKVIKS